MDNLTFESEGHIYRYNGVEVPSVTQVIQAAGLSGLDGVPAELLARNAAFGTAAHKAIELHCKGTLDASTVDEALKPYLAAWGKFCMDYGYESHKQEIRGFHPKYRYGYTIDSIGEIAGQKLTGLTMVEVKTGTETPANKIQIAAYDLAHPVKHRVLLYLKPDSYKAVFCNDIKPYQNVFLSCLSIYNFKANNNLLDKPIRRDNIGI